MKDSGLRVRCEKELRQGFVDTCRLQGKVASDVLRDFMRHYVARESGGLQDGLFDQRPPITEGRTKRLSGRNPA